jgi:hypothetical protein
MSSTISVQLDALEALAGELTALAGELADGADRCAGAARTLVGALDGGEGLTAGSAAAAWSALVRAVADGVRAMVGVLTAALVAYRTAEHTRAARIAGVRRDAVAVAW